MSGSCTCSPQPQATQGSKPAAGSELGLMAMTTWEVSVAEPALSPPFEHPERAAPLAPTTAARPRALTRERREMMFMSASNGLHTNFDFV